MGKLSAADMFALTKREPVSNFNKINQNKSLAKMASGAIAAVSVMLATQLKANAEEEKSPNAIDDIQTSSLGNPVGEASALNASQASSVDSVLGSALEEVTALSQSLGASIGAVQLAALSGSSSSASIQTESGRLPRDFVTESSGVSDPAQQTGSIESQITAFNPGQIANTATPALSTPETIQGLNGQNGVDGRDGIDGQDGADGRDGIDGLDGADGRDGIDGQNGADGRDGIDGQDGANGTNGINGLDGADGRDGINGLNGADGRDGIDGQDGANGTNGINGLDGADGRDGINGLNGADGSDGIDGQDGTNGRDGRDGADGQTIVLLDARLLEQSGLEEILSAQGVEISQGPLGTVSLTLTPDQLDIITSLTNPDTPPSGPGEEEIDHFTPISGTDQEDLLEGTDGNDILSSFGANDILIGGASADTLLGGDGNDTASFVNSSEGVFVNLETGETSGGEAEGDTLTSIENLVGSDLEDVLIGDDRDNQLTGSDGVDTLFGGGNTDVLHGGAGGDVLDGGSSNDDLATYFDSDAAVTISLTDDTASGGHAEGDELDNIESLNGSLFDDFLQGDNQGNRLGGLFGEDILLGEGGNDVLLGGNSADVINGGSGNDTSDYTASLEGVVVSLETGVSLFGEAEGDVLISIENLAGSRFNDTLSGDDGVNRLSGRDGDDTLIGNAGNDRLVGGLGADHLDGGEGNRDAADYSAAEEAVGVDLIGGGFEGEATGDTFDGIEFIVGSDYHDTLLADDGINRVNGGDGCDVIFGRGGNDILLGEEGDDVLNGGQGNDVFIFDFGDGNDIIEDFEAGEGRTDRVQLQGYVFEDFEDLQSSITDTDDGALLSLENGSILFQDISSTDFTADDFIAEYTNVDVFAA